MAIEDEKKFEKMQEPKDNDEISIFKVYDMEYDTQMLSLDSYSKRINEGIINQLKKDIYIAESFRILNDFINEKK